MQKLIDFTIGTGIERLKANNGGKLPGSVTLDLDATDNAPTAIIPVVPARCGYYGNRSQNLFHHPTRHIRQPVIPSAVAIRQLLMIDPHEMQNGGVQVVDVDFVVRAYQPKSSVAPWTMPPLTPPPASHMVKPNG